MLRVLLVTAAIGSLGFALAAYEPPPEVAPGDAGSAEVDDAPSAPRFEVLRVSESADGPVTLRAALDQDGFEALWQSEQGLSPAPEVDMSVWLVVGLTLQGHACGERPELASLELRGETLTPMFHERDRTFDGVGVCNGVDGEGLPWKGWTYVVAVARSDVPPSFVLRAPETATVAITYPEVRLRVGGPGGATVVGPCPRLESEPDIRLAIELPDGRDFLVGDTGLEGQNEWEVLPVDGAIRFTLTGDIADGLVLGNLRVRIIPDPGTNFVWNHDIPQEHWEGDPYEVVWDLRDESGRPMSPGRYHIKLGYTLLRDERHPCVGRELDGGGQKGLGYAVIPD